MRGAARIEREKQIETAAYRLLAEHGYAGTSMLSIAKEAKASNETLYRWYGDKQGLFKAMVQRNAEDVRAFLEADFAIERTPHETIQALGPRLLELLVGLRAVALNRAAAADATGELGAAITDAGRKAVLPLIIRVFDKAREHDMFSDHSAAEAAEIYIGLLVGDLQIRRVIGGLGPLSKREISRRSERALTLLLKVLASGK